MSCVSNYLSCAGRELHYVEWGAGHADDRRGLAWPCRTCRDMDELAAHLAVRYRVICPDAIGRGLSQWSPDPTREYCLAFYVRLATELIDRLGIDRVHWVGTSMGGAIGLLAAATGSAGSHKPARAQRHWAHAR